MAKITLRDYQKDTVSAVVDCFDNISPSFKGQLNDILRQVEEDDWWRREH